MRVAIVNDLALATETLRRLLLEMPGVRIAWTAADGAEALDRARRDRPDLILMDMVMPIMDGAEATKRIMRECPCSIVVVTASIGVNADRVFDALSNGAIDATETPAVGPDWGAARATLRRTIEQVRRLQGSDGETRTAGPPAPVAPRSITDRRCPEPVLPTVDLRLPIALVGASTGGPQALATLLASLPVDFPFALVAVQHLDAAFVPGLVTWLARETGRRVEIARCGEAPRVGVMSIGGGNDEHLHITATRRFGASSEPADAIHRPSVDALFRSAIESRITPFAAALLTGMGRDGAEGLLALRRAGWRTITQDRASSVVWGMPAAAARIDAADAILPLNAIGPELMRTHAERRRSL